MRADRAVPRARDYRLADEAGEWQTMDDLQGFYGPNAGYVLEVPAAVVDGPVALDARSAGEAIEALRRIYCATTGYDYAHIQVAEERAWLRDTVESARFRQPLDSAAKRQLLQRLTEIEAFEVFLQKSLPNQKRFSIEGTDMLVPMLDAIILASAASGTRDVALGMAHRGRLNVLAHVLGKPFGQILGEVQRGIPGPTSA